VTSRRDGGNLVAPPEPASCGRAGGAPAAREPQLLSALATHLQALRARIERACAASGREAGDVRLVGVTKTVAPPVAAELFALGVGDLGESRVQVLERKVAHFAARDLRPTWHLIGHLQRNKARRAVLLADQIHSVDSPALLETLERVAGEEGRRPGIWLELKLVDRATRGGLEPEQLPAVFSRAASCEHLELRGLMTMAAPPEPDAADDADPLVRQAAALEVFRELRRLAESLPAAEAARCADGRVRLSMGMTQDLEAAIHAGSHLVRVGSALVGGAAAEVPR